MKKKIELKSHDGSQNSLEYVDTDHGFFRYKLVTEMEDAPINCTMSRDLSQCMAIDPPGGPMLHIGDKVCGMPIVKISTEPMLVYLMNDPTELR